MPLNDLAGTDAAITERTVAAMLEPIRAGRRHPADDDYLAALRALTRERGGWILDEIQTGVARTALLCVRARARAADILTLGGLGVPCHWPRWWRAPMSAASSPATRAGRSTAIR